MCSLVRIPALVACLLFAASRCDGADKDGLTIDSFFSKCSRRADDFDTCVRDALNSVRHFFKTGVPEYGVGPFDPFFAQEIVRKRSGALGTNYRIKLKNVYESGWTESQVTRFKSDLDNNQIRYSQTFPLKFLRGDYEVEGAIFRIPVSNKGSFNLTLYNYRQTTAISWAPRQQDGSSKQQDGSSKLLLRVRIEAEGAGDMKLHISNLLNGRQVMESLLDRIINASWQPGFIMLKPLIDDVVSSAFTDIFNNYFRDFPFGRVFAE